MEYNILVVDDEKEFAEICTDLLDNDYRKFFIATTGKQAMRILQDTKIHIVILDVMLKETSGIELLEQIKNLYPGLIVVMITAVRSIPQVIKSIQLGAYHYLLKPFKKAEIENVIRNAEEKLELENKLTILQREKYAFNKPFFIGSTRSKKRIEEYVDKIKHVPFTCILLTGETGTGKSNLAKFIHWKYFENMDNFVHISCADISPNLLETELFGYEKGAFTDAKSMKKGLFEIASNGTLFLDEIDSIPKDLQKKLLYFLDNKKIRRVGSTKEISVEVRLIAATNANLSELVEKGDFRKDLYYRLNVMNFNLIPLRERKNDIPLLANYFKDLFNITFSKNIASISIEAIEKLKSHSWPGNIRELKNVIETTMIFCEGSIITVKDVEIQSADKKKTEKREYLLPVSLNDIIPFEEMGVKYIKHVLKLTGDNKTKAAELLGISRTTLRTKVED